MRAQLAGRGPNKNIDAMLQGVNALGRAKLAAEEHWQKGEQSMAVLTGLISLFRFPLRVVDSIEAFQGEQVEFTELYYQFAIEMAKQGKTNAETEMAWEKVWGQITERMLAAYMEARDAFEAYETLKTPLPQNDIFKGLREMWDKGARENAIREAADRLVKTHAYQQMELLGLPAESIKARIFRRSMGMTWRSPPAEGSIGNILYKGFTGRVNKKTGQGTDFSRTRH